jgi:hypothetical protein
MLSLVQNSLILSRCPSRLKVIKTKNHFQSRITPNPATTYNLLSQIATKAYVILKNNTCKIHFYRRLNSNHPTERAIRPAHRRTYQFFFK